MATDRFELPLHGLPAAQVCLAQRVPAGDPARLRAVARRSGAFAAELRHSADVLLSSAESSVWRGAAHQAFARDLRSTAPRLTATAQRYQDYGGALAGYACALELTAPRLASARRQLQQRKDELRAGPPTRQASQPDAAADLLPVARQFKAAYDEWADALDRCIRALLRANDRDPTRDLHGWRAFERTIAAATHSYLSPFEQAILHPSLQNVSACLASLNTQLSVLGMGLLFICPAAGAACLAAATVLAAAQVAVDASRRARGEQVSGTSLGLELAAAIPFGGNAVRSLRAAEDVVHLVPGGGLLAHEAAGGHTLAKHVGKSEEYLRSRLAQEPRLKEASTFYNRQSAESAISAMLNRNRREVDRWLSGTNEELALRGRAATSVGRLIPRRSKTSTAANGVKIVLRRDADMQTGYLLITAMVIE